MGEKKIIKEQEKVTMPKKYEKLNYKTLDRERVKTDRELAKELAEFAKQNIPQTTNPLYRDKRKPIDVITSFSGRGGSYLLAYSGNTLVGFTQFDYSFVRSNKVLNTYETVVREDLRRRGIAMKLTKRLIAIARNKGIKETGKPFSIIRHNQSGDMEELAMELRDERRQVIDHKGGAKKEIRDSEKVRLGPFYTFIKPAKPASKQRKRRSLLGRIKGRLPRRR